MKFTELDILQLNNDFTFDKLCTEALLLHFWLCKRDIVLRKHGWLCETDSAPLKIMFLSSHFWTVGGSSAPQHWLTKWKKVHQFFCLNLFSLFTDSLTNSSHFHLIIIYYTCVLYINAQISFCRFFGPRLSCGENLKWSQSSYQTHPQHFCALRSRRYLSCSLTTTALTHRQPVRWQFKQTAET